MQDDYAIIVGITDYPSPTLKPLKGPVNDASAFRQWVTAPDGGAVPDDAVHVKLRTSQDFAAADTAAYAHPSRDDVVCLFDDVMDTLDAQDEQGRRLYVFFAGHGCSPTAETALRNASLLMANAHLPRRAYNFPGNLAAEHMRTSAYFREVVLVMDCCRDEMSNALLSPPWPPAPEPGDGKLMTAYATDWASKAREREFDGQYRGIFSHSLMAVLNAGQLDGEMLKASVVAHIDHVADKPVKQQPVFNGDLADIQFSEAAVIQDSYVTIEVFGNGEPAEILKTDQATGNLVPVEQYQLSDVAWQGPLAPGTYLLMASAVGVRKQFSVFAAVPAVVTADGEV
jgi:hypothetical protein